jgi:3-deoxy-D-manno-octulosonic acid kinase
MTLALEAPHRHVQRGLRLLVAPRWESGAVALGLAQREGWAAALDSASALPGGRGPQALLETPRWPRAVRIRPAHRGGLLGPWLGDHFLTPSRPERELRLWIALRERGAPLPEPVLAASLRRGPFWHNLFGSVHLEHAIDGAEWLRRPCSKHERALGTHRLGRAIRDFHDAGGVHGDLHLGNLLFEGSGEATRCWLIDLDRARLINDVGPARRMHELARLARSMEKQALGSRLDARLVARLLGAYCGRDRALRQAMRAAWPREARRWRRHRLGWKLGRWIRSLALSSLLVANLGGSIGPLEDAGTAGLRDFPQLALR